jgi:GDSL-like Lipase/Acylhydrolase family
MKRILILFSCLLIYVTGTAQKPIDNYTPYNFWGKVNFKGSFGWPVRDTAFIPDSIGLVTVRPQDTVPYISINRLSGVKNWDKLGNRLGILFSGGGSGGGIAQLGNSGNLWLIRLNDSTYAIDTATANTFYRSLFVQSGGTYANPTWISSLAWSKITGTPTTLSGYGITDAVPSSRTITINGTTLDLSANRSWTISGSGGSTGIRFDSSYTPMGGSRGADSFVVKSMRIRRNNVTVTPTQTGDSVVLWNIDVPIPDSLKQDGDTLRLYFTGASDLAVYNPTGGGGSQTLDQTLALGDSSSRRIVSNDTLKGQDLYVHGSGYYGDSLYDRGDSLISFGSSITAGSGVSTSQRFSYLLAQTYGMIEANFGGGGNTIDAVYAALYKIPTKTSNRGFILFEYNMNDCTTSDTTTWKTKANVIIDTCVARGWTLNKIGFVGGPWSNAVARVNLPNWVRATRTVAETRGIRYFDAYTFMATRGGVALTQDSVHPNALGHYVIAQSAKTAFLEFKKKGLVDVTGNIIGRKTIFAGTPATAAQYPYNSVFVANGKSQFRDKVFIGDTSTLGNAGIVNIFASSGQTGLGVKDLGSTATSIMYGGQIDLINASGHSLKLFPASITVGNGDLNFTGSGGSSLFYLSTYGGGIFNNAGNPAVFRFAGDNQTNLLYVDGTNDKIAIRTATADSVLTVNGSVRLASTVRFSGLPTGKQAFQIYADANGTLYRGDSTVGGGGGGGEANTASNLSGTGVGLFKTKSGVDLQFKKLKAGGNITITDNTDSITIAASASSGMTNPMTTAGDIIYSSDGSGTPARLGIGTEGQVLTSNGTTVYWAAPGAAIYVDSVSNNAAGDSMIVFKNSVRRAYKYPAGGSGWGLSGNASLTAGWTEGNFLGTTGSQSLLIKTNNILRARIDSHGAAGIFRLYPATRTDQYLDYGTTANNWTMYGSGIALTATGGAVNIVAAGANTAAFYNGELVVGSISATGTTKLRIDNANTTKSVMNWSSTTKKTTAADGDWTRDANGVYYGKSTTWNELLMTASVNTVSPTSPDRTITVVIGGTTYYIHAKTTND